MISRAEYIQQPYSGEYIEKIYDIKVHGIQLIGHG